MRNIAYILLLAIFPLTSWTQCVNSSGLPSITCQALSADETFTNGGGTDNGTAPDPSCNYGTGSSSTSTWATFQYDGPPTQQYLVADQSPGGAGNDPAIAIYSLDGCTLLGCNDDNPDGGDPSPGEGAKDGRIDLTTLGLTLGDTYLVRVYNEGNTANSKDALIHCGPSAPLGNCFTSPVVVSDINTTFTTTTNGSTADGCCAWTEDQFGAVPALNCAGPGAISSDGNVYYQFSTCGAGTVTATLSEDACSDGAGSQIWFVDGCNESVVGNQCHNEGDLTDAVLTYSSFTPGVDYYIMVDSYGSNICDVTLTMTGPVCILPIELIDFKVIEKENNEIELKWEIVSDDKDGSFIIERSDKECKEFIEIGEILVNEEVVTKYTFVDNDNLSSDRYFYRLSKKDKAGVVDNMRVASVIKSKLQSFRLINVFKIDEGKIQLHYFTDESINNIELEIYNIQGDKIINKNFNFQDGWNSSTLEIPSVSSNILVLRFNINGNSSFVNKKIIF